MELAVPAPAAAASIGHGILSLTGAPQDPFERLDATMEPTPEWVHLRGVLEENPASVRNIISLALLKEVARSFQNVAGQLQAMREIKEQFERLLESEEAASLEHLMRDIPPSDIHALEREACGINEDSRTLRSALETGDISGLHSRAKHMANKARRFREKHARLRPSLDKLQRGLMDIASKCAEKAQRSDELIAEVEQRKDFWWNLLVVANCLALLGGAGFIICLLPTTCLSLVHLLAKSWAIGKAKVLLSTAKAFATKTAAAATTKAAAAQTAQATAATTKAALATATAKAETAKHLASSLGTAAAAEGAAGTAAAVGAGVAAGGAASVASIGAPAATFLGSQMLGSLGVSLGLMSTPAAPIGVVLGSGAAAAAAVKLIWESVTSVDTAAALNAAQAATSAVAQQQAAEQAANAAAAAMEAGQAASEASQAASQAAAALNDAADSVSALEAAISSLSATVTADATFLFGGFLLMALVLLGYAGRDLVKTLLGRLWAAEIEEHRRHKATFQHMEQVVRKAADQLLMVYKKNKALESCLDIVVEVAEDLAAKAEDALEARSEEKEAEMATLHEQVEQLCTLYENVDEDEGWILIKSSSLPLPLRSPSASDCLPSSTYILVPVMQAAQLGALFAAGPSRDEIIKVSAQGSAARLMRNFCIGGSASHDFTADHPLRVMRSGNWIQEQASTVRVGDILNTSDGMKKVESTRAPRMSSEQVFSLDIQQGGEVYVFTPTSNPDGQLSWSGVAVLGHVEKTQRSCSAPPLSKRPSRGSWLCKGKARCSNICRLFQRGKCVDGEDCRFCHFPHAEEPKRQPRARDSGSSQGA
ncbi:unnamed protein product [Durusdinium trenchii]|uniref:C3H1-type domain-containing protein n=1 Tax=Durusdinium trenchii TaxID=1381693 RepID=A0ABP0S5Q5_9DINO